MTGNRCVVYVGPGQVAVEDIGYPELALPEQNRKCDHGVILKIVSPPTFAGATSTWCVGARLPPGTNPWT